MKTVLLWLGLAAALLGQNAAKYPSSVATSADLGIAGNRAETTLKTGIDSSATSLSVASGTQFRSGMYVTVDNEFVAVCNVSGNTLTVGRSSCPNADGRGLDVANGGGSAASHLAGAKVQARISAWHHNQVAAEVRAVEDALKNGIQHDLTINGNVAIAATVQATNLPIPATAFAGSDIGAQVNAAFASCGTCVIHVPSGNYAQTTTISYPVATNGKGGLQIDGTLNYSGTDCAIQTTGGPVAAANLRIFGSGRITTLNPAAKCGIHLNVFNKGTVRDIQVDNFTGGDGILVEGANTVDLLNLNVGNNKNNVRLLSTRVNSANYSPNAIRILGGHQWGHIQYGIFDDASAEYGTHIGNTYSTTFDPPTNGGIHIFLQSCDSCQVTGNYLEYNYSDWGTAQVQIGDANNHPNVVNVSGNVFLSPPGTAHVVYDFGTRTTIDRNLESGNPAVFVEWGAGHTGSFIGANRASGATTQYTGENNSEWIYAGGTGVNNVSATTDGIGFNSITGNGQDLVIKTRHNGTSTIRFQNVLGQTYGTLSDAGVLDVPVVKQYNVFNAGSATPPSSTPRFIWDTVALSGGEVIVTFAVPFTNIGSYVCTANDTAQPNVVRVLKVSASQVHFIEAGSAANQIAYQCIGF